MLDYRSKDHVPRVHSKNNFYDPQDDARMKISSRHATKSFESATKNVEETITASKHLRSISSGDGGGSEQQK